MPNIFLGTPTTRDFSGQYVACLYRTRNPGSSTYFTYIYGQAIDVGRNAVVRSFLKTTKFDYLLMHDSDATWHADAVMRLAERELPVVTGVIFQRKLPTVPTIGKFCGLSVNGDHMYGYSDTINRILEIGDRLQKEKPDYTNDLLLDKTPGDVQEIDGAGAHFMLIRRDVLEAIEKDTWYESTSINAGEDFAFCRKVQAAGFKLYVDYSVFTGHIVGPGMDIGLREFMLFRDKAKAETAWVA